MYTYIHTYIHTYIKYIKYIDTKLHTYAYAYVNRMLFPSTP